MGQTSLSTRYGETEVGGFAISSEADPLLVIDLRLVTQRCTIAHVAFEDESVADLFDEQVDAGRQPNQFARIWAHTHPGDSPEPSSVDEETFARVFGRSEWSVMFILARKGATYARLHFNLSQGVDIELAVEIDYTLPFEGCDQRAWEQEYIENVAEEDSRFPARPLMRGSSIADPFDEGDRDHWYDSWMDYVAEEESHVE